MLYVEPVALLPFWHVCIAAIAGPFQAFLNLHIRRAKLTCFATTWFENRCWRYHPATWSSWWFQRFLEFSPLFGDMIQFDSYFSNGLKPLKPPTFRLSRPEFSVKIGGNILEHSWDFDEVPTIASCCTWISPRFALMVLDPFSKKAILELWGWLLYNCLVNQELQDSIV